MNARIGPLRWQIFQVLQFTTLSELNSGRAEQKHFSYIHIISYINSHDSFSYVIITTTPTELISTYSIHCGVWGQMSLLKIVTPPGGQDAQHHTLSKKLLQQEQYSSETIIRN